MLVNYNTSTRHFSLVHDNCGLRDFQLSLYSGENKYSSSDAKCQALEASSYQLEWPEGIEATYDFDILNNKCILSLTIKNNTTEPLSLREIHMIDCDSEGLRLGEGITDWLLYKNGLRKNDLVSTHRFSHADFHMKDLIGAGGELGDVNFEEAGDSYAIESHYMTLLKSVSTDDSMLMASLDPQREFSTHNLYCSKDEKQFKGLRVVIPLENTVIQPKDSLTLGQLLLSWEEPFEAINSYTSMTKQTCHKDKKVPKTGWCSWYFFYEHVTEQDILNQLDMIKKYDLPLEAILIDMGWEERLGTWYANHKFSHGMKWIADKIKEQGMKPGLWLSPFWVEQRSLVHLHHPDWLLKDTSGKPVVFHCHVDGYVIDPSIPEACQWITETFRRVSKDWGFELVKVDFLRVVALYEEAIFAYPMTKAEALRRGMEAIRRGIGEDTTLIACGGQYGPTLGIADINRTSNDISAKWSSLRNTFKKNMLRFWMNDNWWMNDPDCLIIRNEDEGVPGCTAGSKDNHQGGFTDTEVETILNLYKALKGTFYIGDDLTCLSPYKIKLIKNAIEDMHYERKGAVPRDLFKNKYPHILLERISDSDSLITLVNWDETKETALITLNYEDISVESKYHSYTIRDKDSKKGLGTLSKEHNTIQVEIPLHASRVLIAEVIR